MLSIKVLLALLLPLYLSTFLIKLLRNYLVARKSGFPIQVVPIHPNHVVWMLIGQPIRPLLKRHLPYWLYSWIVPTIYGWEQLERRILFRQKQTDTFMLVTCNKNELWTVYPVMVADALKRPDTFRKTDTAKVVLETFGGNVFTSEGEAWARQRKIITGIINERVSKVVFEESWRQTRGMTADIEDLRATNVDKNVSGAYGAVFPSMKRIAANVLFRAGYGMPRDFKEEEETPSEAHGKRNFNMIQCISIYITDLVPAALIPKVVLQNWPVFIPGARWMRDMGAAVDQIPGHIQKQLDNERRILDQTPNEGAVRNNILSMLIQASEYGANEDGQSDSPALKNGKPQKMLSEEELSGNLLVFTIAGFETTANVLTFALVLLMTEPKWQEWLIEEIDELFAQTMTKTNDATDAADDFPDYAAFFPKALRCLSVMMEVMRLYPPVVHLPRSTPAGAPTTIETSKGPVALPADAYIYLPLAALHVRPDVWRNLNIDEDVSSKSTRSEKVIEDTLEEAHAQSQDEYQFRPSRWINNQLKQMSDGTMAKTLFQPPKGTFAPFSGGARVCPGQKMAQVEFVCVILALLKDYRIEAVKKPGEDDERLQQRLKQTLKDCHAEVTIVMDRLHDVDVRFVKRSKS